MKKVVMAGLVCFLVVGATAQNEEGWSKYNKGSITIKPAIGLSLTDFSKAPPGGESKARVGYQIGGTIIVGNKFYIEPGIFYTRKSTRYVTSGTSADNVKLNINGFRVPVGIGFNILGDESTLFSLHATAGASAFFVTGVNGDDKRYYKSPTYGVFAGAGVNAGLFFADISYEWSLTNVQKDVSQIDVGRSRSLFYSAGVRLRI